MAGWSPVLREVLLVPGTGGVFDLEVDGALVWSKARDGSRSGYPEPDDVLPALRVAIGAEVL
jgi:selenoprotein W-related protein